MNKLAAEKIASEYYDLGIKLAQDKIASGFQKAFQKTMNAGMGGIGGIAASEAYTQQLRDALAKSEYLKNVFTKGDASRALSLASDRMKSLSDDVYNLGPSKSELLKIISDSKATLGEGGISSIEKAVDAVPALALAGGVAIPMYKGLGKLDRKLKIY